MRAGSCAARSHSPCSSIHAALLVCPCREHHDDSDGVHGERSAGLFPQGECCMLTAGLHHLLGLQRASLSSSFSSSSFLSFFPSFWFYLQKHEGQLTASQLLSMLQGIAAGMKYLAEMGYIHKSLAAHKVLVNSSLACKITGFRRLQEDKMETIFSTMVRCLSEWDLDMKRVWLGICPSAWRAALGFISSNLSFIMKFIVFN